MRAFSLSTGRRSRRVLLGVGVAVGALFLQAFAPAAATPGAQWAAASDLVLSPADARPELIHPSLQTEAGTAGDEPLEVLVKLRPTQIPSTARNRPGKAAEAMRQSAARSQGELVETITTHGDHVVNTFWLDNMVLAEVREETMLDLTRLPNVEKIVPNFPVYALPTTKAVVSTEAHFAGADDGAEEADRTWGIDRIEAHRVHAAGIDGTGIRVATLDSGVDISHPDLQGKMATDDPADPAYPGGWMEFAGDGSPVVSVPHDSQHHGTHVSGTIHGGDASGITIGVAPGSTMMHALVLPRGSGTYAQVVAGMQWALAPYDATGQPAGQPADVVNMSLGAIGFYDEFIQPVRNLRLAGVFPAIAIGNNCLPGGTANPGNVYDAVAVGATDVDEDVPSFSCGGVVKSTNWDDPPAYWPDEYVKPDLTAPGADVYSTMPGGGYAELSGTSMATPHVAGAAALLLEAAADLSVEDAVHVLGTSADFDDRYGEARPNPRYGQGRINVFRAVQQVGHNEGITGTVTDAESANPLVGVAVSVTPSGASTTTDDTGAFKLRLPAGNYRLMFTRFGYQATTLDSVTVAEGSYAHVTPGMEPTPRGTITGLVAYGPTGSVVPGARVELVDAPDPIRTDTNMGGRFTLDDVPVGTYRLQATAPGLTSIGRFITVESGGEVVADLRLPRPTSGVTTRASETADGVGGDAAADDPAVSADGRFVTFFSAASNLVPGDTNGTADIFVKDRVTGEIERVSVASDGTQANERSFTPDISEDGRFVTFHSLASNLVEGDTNGQFDIFVHDRQTGVTERVSVSSDGGESDGYSFTGSISADGRYVAFTSAGTNLVDGDTNSQPDVFVRDRQAGVTERVSVRSDGGQVFDGSSQFADITPDGRYVAFESRSNDLDPRDNNVQCEEEDNECWNVLDVYVHDRVTGETELISIAPDGTTGDRNSTVPTISDDGRYVAFSSYANTFVPPEARDPNGMWTIYSQIYLRDRQTGSLTFVSQSYDGSWANGGAANAVISGDGSTLAFYSFADNIVPDDVDGLYDVYLYDVASGYIEEASRATDGTDNNGRWAVDPALSQDGAVVVFNSDASNLIPDDTNGDDDIFIRERADTSGGVAQFVVWDLGVTPGVPKSTHAMTVTARVKNVGDVVGTHEAILRVDGVDVDRTTVRVGADAWTWVRFPVRLPAGEHHVEIGPLETVVTVR